jgi:hypothetical protein
MKVIHTLVLSLLLLAATLQAKPLTVAVLGFETSAQRPQPAPAEITELLATFLGTNPELLLVERVEIDKILGEQTLGLSGLINPDAAVRVGQILGAKALIMGRIIPAEDQTILVAKVMSTETSRVFGETVNLGKSPPDSARELAEKIGVLLEKNREAFSPRVITREERVAKLSEVVQGNGRTVSVRIEEKDLGRPVIDPAAQTEMEKILLELGFTIFNPATADASAPHLRIGGEAFSQPGARRGQLVSSRARVEVRVEDSAGHVLAVDAETATAVDTAEAVAGKTALQEAALTLLERIAPKLSSPSDRSELSDPSNSSD